MKNETYSIVSVKSRDDGLLNVVLLVNGKKQTINAISKIRYENLIETLEKLTS